MTRLQSRQISQLHLYQVLHTVRLTREPMSRAEICERTGLSQAAVSSLTRRLLDSGALIETGARPSLGGGRRERELALHAEHLFVAGVKVSTGQLTTTLTDFAGAVRNTVKAAMASPITQTKLVKRVAREIERCLAGATGVERQRLSGVGVAVPGLVDSLAGEVLWCPELQATRSRSSPALAEALSDALGVPVFIENDANMLTLAEQWFGEAGHLPNVAVVSLEQGLGLGLIVNGELHRGHLGLAAEIGHVQIEAGGRPCRCGNRGCLEAYVAKYAMVAEAREMGLLLPEHAERPDAIELAYDQLVERAIGGHAGTRALFERQGRLLGLWLGNLVNLVSPQLVILDTGHSRAAELYAPVLELAMREALVLPGRRQTTLRVGHRGEEIWARGAAVLVLQRLDESTAIVHAVARHAFESPQGRAARSPPSAGVKETWGGPAFP